MVDKFSPPPASTLEVLQSVPESALRRLKQYSGRLATEAVHALETRLPFFADLEASQRASVQLVVQTAVINFVEWMRDPNSDVGYTAQAFEVVPQDLRRRVALRQSVEMVRVTMEYFEEVVPLLARNEQQLTALLPEALLVGLGLEPVDVADVVASGGPRGAVAHDDADPVG